MGSKCDGIRINSIERLLTVPLRPAQKLKQRKERRRERKRGGGERQRDRERTDKRERERRTQLEGKERLKRKSLWRWVYKSPK